MQYHFGVSPVNAAGRRELAATLSRELAHETAGINFWGSQKGQALIDSLNGGPTSTQLGDWLAASLPNLYGVGAGTHEPVGETARFTWQDPAPLKGERASFYYVRVQQKDGNMAWASAIWVVAGN